MFESIHDHGWLCARLGLVPGFRRDSDGKQEQTSAAGQPGSAATPCQAPWPFTGGTIHQAVVDVSGEPFVDFAAEARMAFLRD